MPSHIAVPWIQAMGNRIAPAIKKPHEAVLRQTTMCVIQDAITQVIRIKGSSSSMVSSRVFVFSLPVFEEVVEHLLTAFEVVLRPFFGDHEPRLRYRHKDVCTPCLRQV